ncbi:MAG: sigma factor-like helix-turn-helix DNA-binding protein [Dehalobacterium sp.]
MAFLQHINIDSQSLHSLYLRITYNFAYRLSGSTEVAKKLTEKVILMHSNNQEIYSDIILLKQAWKDFLIDYACLGLKGEDQVQQALLLLPPELRCAVILRDVLGYSYGQIAAVLNKSNSEVGNLISMGRQKITKYSKKANITC